MLEQPMRLLSIFLNQEQLGEHRDIDNNHFERGWWRAARYSSRSRRRRRMKSALSSSLFTDHLRALRIASSAACLRSSLLVTPAAVEPWRSATALNGIPFCITS